MTKKVEREKEGRDTIDDDSLFSPVGNLGVECDICKGRGCLDSFGDNGLPISRRCKCVLKKDIEVNMDRRWKNLSKAIPIEDSILKRKTNEDLWITAPLPLLKKHLRHVAFRKGPLWNFKVTNDAKLITAWLATAGLKGDIFDPDAVSLEELTLIDLVVPSELLIIVLGVKTANNKEMANVLLESLTHREYENKPTWICDQPHHQLEYGHKCFSEDISYYLEDWEHIYLDGTEQPITPKTTPKIDVSAPKKKSRTQEPPPTKRAGKMSLTGTPKPFKKR